MVASRPRTRAARLSVNCLENRLTPSWGSVPPTWVNTAGFADVALNSAGDASGSAAITSGEADWYRFKVGAGTLNLSALTPASSADTVIGLYTNYGKLIASSDNAAAGDTDSRLTATLTAGEYFLGVSNKTGTPNGAYTWAIDGPGAAAPPDDGYEDNDTQAAASDLGSVAATKAVPGLALADAADWYKFTTTGGTGGSAAMAFTATQGNLDLRLVNAAGTVLATSAGTGNAETVSLNGLAAGTYWVQVYGANNPAYTLTVTPPTPAPSGFSITLRLTGMTATQQAVFQQAADRWSQIIVGDLPDAVYNSVAVDDVLIDASAVAMDGPYGTLGSAGPDNVRSGSYLPVHGTMRFDTADLAMLESSGGLFHTIFHEMGHVLGIGTLWSYKGLLAGSGTADPRFTGPKATAEYNALFGRAEGSVPVENTGGSGTREGHWRESVFDTEVMTGWLDAGSNPASRVTLASLADMGYVVNMTAADFFAPPAGLVSGGTGSGSSGGGMGLWHGCGCAACQGVAGSAVALSAVEAATTPAAAETPAVTSTATPGLVAAAHATPAAPPRPEVATRTEPARFAPDLGARVAAGPTREGVANRLRVTLPTADDRSGRISTPDPVTTAARPAAEPDLFGLGLSIAV